MRTSAVNPPFKKHTIPYSEEYIRKLILLDKTSIAVTPTVERTPDCYQVITASPRVLH